MAELESVEAEAASNGESGLDREAERNELRTRVLAHLHAQGFAVRNGRLIAPVLDDKARVRALHAGAVAEQRSRAERALRSDDGLFVHHLADGSRVDVAAIRPRLVQITDRRGFDGRLWRWCALHWSIPVSSGYGRRLRFLVVDDANQRIMGLIGLGDPVFALGARDVWVGWSPAARRERLANVMDAFVLGAVPPYSTLRGGKLMALLAISDEVRETFAERYGHRKTLIAGRDPHAQLALVTTTSALGRSSVYNRLTGPEGTRAFLPVGYTAGSGDFHLSGSIYNDLVAYLAANDPDGRTHAHARWKSKGPRNRREVLQRALDKLGLDSRQLRLHGIRRQVFAAPLARNFRECLKGTEEPEWIGRDVDTVTNWWRKRWAAPRAARDDSWRDFDPQTWTLWPRDEDDVDEQEAG